MNNESAPEPSMYRSTPRGDEAEIAKIEGYSKKIKQSQVSLNRWLRKLSSILAQIKSLLSFWNRIEIRLLSKGGKKQLNISIRKERDEFLKHAYQTTVSMSQMFCM